MRGLLPAPRAFRQRLRPPRRAVKLHGPGAWPCGGEEQALRFFGHFCPRPCDLSTVACRPLEKQARSEQFLARVRHVTQVVLDVGVAHRSSRV